MNKTTQPLFNALPEILATHDRIRSYMVDLIETDGEEATLIYSRLQDLERVILTGYLERIG